MRMLWIFVGGGLGSLARYGMAGWVQNSAGAAFPWGTLAVNASGCFGIGLLATLLAERSAAGPELRLFLLVGILGGYTTFSTFGLESLRLFESGDWWRGAANVLGSMTASLVGVFAGALLGRSLA